MTKFRVAVGLAVATITGMIFLASVAIGSGGAGSNRYEPPPGPPTDEPVLTPPPPGSSEWAGEAERGPEEVRDRERRAERGLPPPSPGDTFLPPDQ